MVTDYATAELVKVAANAFLATKISFINAMAEVCEVAGADVVDLADALGHDDRIGRKFLNAGIGFGGGCLPKDIRAFLHRAGELGVDEHDGLPAPGRRDQPAPARARRRTSPPRCSTAPLGDARIAVLGRGVQARQRRRPRLPRALDRRPAAPARRPGDASTTRRPATTALRDVPDADVRRPTPSTAPRDADLLLHLTEWQEFRAVDPVALGEVVARKQVLDGRNCLDFEAWRAAGWTVRGLGRR